ncbi:peptidyl-prolyl cis-trans isomerase CYP40-like [Oryza brachyantha]|uniref:peptidylprolyl isomerase n=1 Tax=Oryza brachyantha TaxID=4533 RepID=J3LHB9_ORYBR|nr:peptidyl-prolyl cis-trans isomerase CYP40-like [Oryza brachyantha]
MEGGGGVGEGEGSTAAAAEMVVRNPRCYLDVSIGGDMEGRIVVELYASVAPRTAENFRALCTGEKGASVATGTPLHYKGSCIHRIVKGFMVQGGDITAGDGTGGESIYGPNFGDENFVLKHERKGMLSMANAGPNTNGSQFFITTTRTPHLDGKHVVFGRVIKGMGVVRSMEHVSVGEADCPTTDIVIVDCGELPEGGSDGVVNFFKDGDLYPDWPNDLDEKPTDISWWMNAVDSAKSFGNENFKKKDFKAALKKYRKAMRYLDLCWEKEEIDEEKSSALRKTKSIILTNSSACKLKLGDLKGALLDADFALREAEGNPKAFFRQGQARMALNDIDAAVESFKHALQLEPTDGGIKRELAAVKKKIADRRNQERKAFSRMFQPSGGSEKIDEENI